MYAFWDPNVRRHAMSSSNDCACEILKVSTGSLLVLQGGHAAVVDDTIDYIKFLQSRVKVWRTLRCHFTPLMHRQSLTILTCISFYVRNSIQAYGSNFK